MDAAQYLSLGTALDRALDALLKCDVNTYDGRAHQSHVPSTVPLASPPSLSKRRIGADSRPTWSPVRYQTRSDHGRRKRMAPVAPTAQQLLYSSIANARTIVADTGIAEEDSLIMYEDVVPSNVSGSSLLGVTVGLRRSFDDDVREEFGEFPASPFVALRPLNRAVKQSSSNNSLNRGALQAPASNPGPLQRADLSGTLAALPEEDESDSEFKSPASIHRERSVVVSNHSSVAHMALPADVESVSESHANSTVPSGYVTPTPVQIMTPVSDLGQPLLPVSVSVDNRVPSSLEREHAMFANNNIEARDSMLSAKATPLTATSVGTLMSRAPSGNLGAGQVRDSPASYSVQSYGDEPAHSHEDHGTNASPAASLPAVFAGGASTRASVGSLVAPVVAPSIPLTVAPTIGTQIPSSAPSLVFADGHGATVFEPARLGPSPGSVESVVVFPQSHVSEGLLPIRANLGAPAVQPTPGATDNQHRSVIHDLHSLGEKTIVPAQTSATVPSPVNAAPAMLPLPPAPIETMRASAKDLSHLPMQFQTDRLIASDAGLLIQGDVDTVMPRQPDTLASEGRIVGAPTSPVRDAELAGRTTSPPPAPVSVLSSPKFDRSVAHAPASEQFPNVVAASPVTLIPRTDNVIAADNGLPAAPARANLEQSRPEIEKKVLEQSVEEEARAEVHHYPFFKQHEVEGCSQQFRALEVSGTGYIGKENLRKLFQQCGERISEKTLQRLLQQQFMDGLSQFTFHEFMKLFVSLRLPT